MIALEKIAEQLKNHKADGIFDVEIHPDGYVRSQLENRVDPGQPYTLTVQPVAEEHTLRICIPLVTAEQQDIPIPGVSASANISLGGGDLKVDSKSGISFELNHIYQEDDGSDLSPDLLRQLIDGMLRDFRQVETLLLQGQQLVESFMKITPTMFSGF
jgi:hypothetical protein